MVPPSHEQAQVEMMFPAIARYVRGHGFVEIGDQESFGFVVRESATVVWTSRMKPPRRWPRRWPSWRADCPGGSSSRESNSNSGSVSYAGYGATLHPTRTSRVAQPGS